MSDTIRVFISSKQSELDTERAIAAEQARRVGLEPILAEEWPPARDDIRSEYLKRVREAPIYIGIFYRVYSKPSVEEYSTAIEHPYREILIYQRNSGAEERDNELTKLLGEIATRHVYFRYEKPEDLLKVVSQHLKAALVRMLDRLLSIGEKRGGLSWGTWSKTMGSQSSLEQFLHSLGFIDGLYERGKAVDLSDQIRQLIKNAEMTS